MAPTFTEGSSVSSSSTALSELEVEPELVVEPVLELEVEEVSSDVSQSQ